MSRQGRALLPPATGKPSGPLRRAWALALLNAVALPLLLAACSNQEPVMVVRTPDPSRQFVGSFGLVTLIQTERPSHEPCLKLSGQFVHYSHIHPEAVVRAIDPEIGRLPNEGVLGQCHELRTEERPAGVPGESAGGSSSFLIELLDAGSLLVRHPGGTAQVEPQPFPDVLASVGGVVYGTAPADCIPLSGEGELTVQTAGGPDVGTFSVQLPVPQQPEIGAVDGIVPEEGRILLGRQLQGPLTVQWQEPENGSDVFHIELEAGEWRALCYVPDRGAFTIPAAVIDAAPPTLALQLRVRRIRVQPFTAPGIREGEIVTIVQDEVNVAPGDPF